MLRKELTVSDLLKERRGAGSSTPGSGRSTPREEQQQQGQQHQSLAPRQQLRSSPMSSPGQLLPSGSAAPQRGTQHGLELQPVLGQPQPGGITSWQQQQQQQQWGHPSNSASEADEDTAGLLSSAGAKHVGSRAATEFSAADADYAQSGSSSSARGQGQAAWRYLRAVDWGAAFPLPSQAAVLGGTAAPAAR
jgi:hypothetical protein